MFTGIIESSGKVERIDKYEDNVSFIVQSNLVPELKVDQSLSHNGVCLTVEEINTSTYKVTAIKETLDKTNLGSVKEGDSFNLERCLPYNGRLDGHIVQGHVDTMAILKDIKEEGGSWRLRFEHPESSNFITVEKGSVCVNGISLTVVNSKSNSFEVAIIPYTWNNTNLCNLTVNSEVNIEFDILGKYVARYMDVFKGKFKVDNA
ncbi:MAG: riboflavin synthase [Bacteroidia bacterium]